jgi:NADPH:quinone reductase-like Zn-dependent oxidoreductase
MRAMVCEQYGPPDVFQLREVEQPTPADTQVLIRVRAATAGPADCAFRKGTPFIVKLIYGLRKPKFPIMGAELAGEVQAIGRAVTSYKPGDRVLGLSPNGFGAYAEYTCLLESDPLAIIPASMSYDEAVGICDGATTALTFLRDVARLQPGQRVLINGASGAVGAYGVQLAKYFGAEVTGVCSTGNVALVQSLGADAVIDYTSEDFTKTGRTYDVIFDAVGKSSYARCRSALAPRGVYLTTVPSLAIVRDVLLTTLGSGKQAKFATAGLMQSKANLLFLTELVEAGKLRAVIDRCYPLEQLAEAHRYVETERKKGNVVIHV